MEVVEVEANEYGQVFSKPSHVFNSVAFNAFNAFKCERVYYLIFKDTKIRLGIILGLRDGVLVSPFSAPYGGFQYGYEDVRLNQIDAALVAIQKWMFSNAFKEIKIVLPPIFYNVNFLTKLTSSLYRANFQVINLDINYQFPTHKFDENYLSIVWQNAKKNIKRANNAGLIFEKLETSEGETAYDIIAENRTQRGFPIRMTWEELKKTINLIPADFFIVKKDNVIIASAIIFQVSEGIVQVVYWGDLPQFSEYKTMNFLSYEIFKYYKKIEIKVVDIGPSSENSIPNHGLCEFKESIGCDLSPKYSFYKKIE